MEYIERQAAADVLCDACGNVACGKECHYYRKMQAIPAVSTRPVEWIPVTKRLPEDLTFVLAVEDGTVFMAHCEHYYGEEEVYVEWHDTMFYPVSPTHWMPLPEPPKTEQLKGYSRRKPENH